MSLEAARRQNEFLMRLLFDVELRERFCADPSGTLETADLPVEDREVFSGLDPKGLELDASMRERYLMSALCRPFPLSAAAIGSHPSGRRRLRHFLASPAIFQEPAERTRLFGTFLTGVLVENEFEAPGEVLTLLAAFLELEQARAHTAAQLRQSVEAGHTPPAPTTYSNNAIKNRGLALPPHFLAAQLPVTSQVLKTALDHVTPETAWAQIESGSLQFERILTVARAEPIPVTALCRCVHAGRAIERAGAGGVSPIVDVKHLYVEITGSFGQVLGQLDGTVRLKDLPPSMHDLIRNLIQAGFIVLA